MAGPTDLRSLIRYARLCGVSTSLRALQDMGMTVAKLVMHTDSMQQLDLQAHHCATDATRNIIGIHLYSVGGFPGSAQWMHDAIAATAASPGHSQAL